MPFNPTLPANGSQILSAELREQFTALKDLIDEQAAAIANHALVLADLQSQIDTLSDQVVQLSTNVQNNYVTSEQLSNTLNTYTAGLPGNDVNWGDGFSDPPTSQQVQSFVDVYNTLVDQLRRI